MITNEEIRQTTWRMENVLNQIPSYYYVPKDYLHDYSNDYGTFLTSIGLIPKKEAQGEKKKNIKYHPAYWYITSFVAQQTPSQKDFSQVKTSTVSRNELLKRLNENKMTRQQTNQSKAPLEKSSNFAETKHVHFSDKKDLNNTCTQQMASTPTFFKRKTKRKCLVEALHVANDHKQVLSKLQEDQKEEFEKNLARDVALRRVMGERVYTDVKRIKKALKTRKKKQLKKKTKAN